MSPKNRSSSPLPGRRPPRPRSRPALPPRRPWRDLLGAIAVFVLATVVLTYPLSFHPSSVAPFGAPTAEDDAWALSWVAHRFATQPLELFDANRFYPLPQTLAYSEHLAVPGLIATPLLLITDDLVLTYNLVLLTAIFASALGMYLLAVTLTGNPSAGVLAGLFFSFAPLRFEWLSELPMQLYAFLPLALACTRLFSKTGARRWAWAFVAFLVLQSLSGNYLAAMAITAGLIALAVELAGSAHPRRNWSVLPLALTCAAVVLYAFVRPYAQVRSTLDFEPHRIEVESRSASPMTYLASSSRLYGPLSDLLIDENDRTEHLFPGLTLLLLGATGSIVLLLRKGDFFRPWATLTWCWLILAAGLIFSLGDRTPVYGLLSEPVFFSNLRAPTRFALLPLFSLSVLSSFALAWLLPGFLRSRPWATVAIAVFFILESSTSSLELSPLRDEPQEVYPWLAERAEPGAIVELPYRLPKQSYLFWAKHHHFRPQLNGGHRQIPISHHWMERLLEDFPSTDSITLLQRLEVRYVILHMGSYEPRALLRILNDLTEHRRDLFPVRDFSEILVFEIMPPRHPPPSSKEPIRTPVAKARLGNVAGSTTGRITEVEIFYRDPRSISGVRLHYGRNPRAPAAYVELMVSDGRGGWSLARASHPDWPALTELVLGILENPLDGTQDFYFDPLWSEEARVRVRLTGSEAAPAITEVELLGYRHPS